MIKAHISSAQYYAGNRKVFVKDCVNVTIFNLGTVDVVVRYNNIEYPLPAKTNQGLSQPFVIDVSGHMFDAEIELDVPQGGSCVVNQACQSKC